MKDLRTTKEILDSFKDEDLVLMMDALSWFKENFYLRKKITCEKIIKKLKDLRELNFSEATYDD